jgi:MYXO-CTERM domain-containing protein
VLQYIRKPCRVLLATIPAFSLLLGVALPRQARAASSVEKLQDFPLDQAQITDSYQQTLFSKEMTYLLTTLDSDRLMAGFKAVSQNVTPTNLYGGWENQAIRGHTLGHWLSAVAHAYQQAQGSDATLASQIKTKLDDVISKLKSYQLSSGYLFATSISQFDQFDSGASGTSLATVWVPYYTLHKILAGLVDVYKYESNADALAVASKLGDWLYSRATGWSASAKSTVLGQEYGGLNDALYELYKYTNSANHLTVAHIFDDTGLFTTLAAGTDNLSGRHANMTIPKFVGALNRYRTVGASESAYLNAASGFFGVVLKDHTYVTGGNSEDEHFHAPNMLDQYRDNVNNETCNAYNMSKLTHDLFKTTGDVKYANFYEKIHINEILSSMNPDTGMTTYFKPMGTGYFKAFGTTDTSFWCCTGTGMENFTRLNDSVYFHDDKDLWVTFYVSSTLNWKDRGLSLTQTTDLPNTNKVNFTITTAPTDAVNLQFRKPDWASTCQVAVAVNGQAVTPVEANGFLGVSRVWQANDTVQLAFPLFVQVSRLQDNQNAVAFTYGPIVLSAGLGTASMTTTGHAMTIAATSPGGLQDTITINSGTAINTWLSNIQNNLVQTAGKLEFTPKGTDSDSKLVFIPHYSRYKDRYGIYWKLAGTAGGTATTTVTCPTVSTGGTGGAGGSTGAPDAPSATGGQSGSGGPVGADAGAGYGGRGGAGGSSTSGAGGSGGTRTGSGGAGGGSGTVSAGGTGGTAAAVGGAGGSTNSVGSGGSFAGSGGIAGSGGTRTGAGGTVGSSGGSSGTPTGGTTGGCACNLGRPAGRSEAFGMLLVLGLVAWRRRIRRKHSGAGHAGELT